MIRKLKLFFSLEPLDRRMLMEALLLPGLIWLGFRIMGVPRTQGLLRRWAAGTKNGPSIGIAAVQRARRAQTMIRRNLGRPGNCLVRSLTLWAMLLRRGVVTDLRVGFRKRDGRIEGHAWLEHDDTPINEALSEARSYVPYDKPVTFDLWRQIRSSDRA